MKPREWRVVLKVTDDCDPEPMTLDEIKDIVLRCDVSGIEVEIVEIRQNQS